MRRWVLILIGAIPAILLLKRAFQSLQIITILNEGMTVAAAGGDIGPSIEKVILLAIVISGLGFINWFQ